MNRFKVIFAPSFREIIVDENKTVLDAAREAGVYVDSHCNGKGSCGKCKIRVTEGNTNPFTTEEGRFIKEQDRENGYRLACMTRVAGNITVFVPGENIVKSAVAKKLFSKRSKFTDPAVKSFMIELPPEESGKKSLLRHAYLESITEILAERFNLVNITCDLTCLQEIASAIKEGDRKITVFVWMDKEIITIRPSHNKKAFGIALDVGTTTVALYLCDLRTGNIEASGSITNPQVLFGTDVMSRISYSVDHPLVGVKKMQKELFNAVNTTIAQIADGKLCLPHEIVDMTVVGNTVMHHIILGIAPDHLGLWPFSPTIQGSVDVKARDLGLNINPAAYVHSLPVEAGFVGADNVAVLLSEEPYNKSDLSLTIDLGTNGELVLGNKDRLVSCSCATGPALEGAHISSGMRATVGAIEKVRIDPVTFEPDYAVVGTDGWASTHERGSLKPAGICGSGIIDVVAHLLKSGLIGKNGAFSENLKTPRLRPGSTGILEYVIAWKDETATGNDIVLNQKDIRQIQLAKGALQGGCRILMQHFGMDSLNRIVIAGAFGMHIDKENALAIGLFPPCDPKNVITVGNAAGHGAYLALIDRKKREQADTIAAMVEHIELALEKNFQKEFMRSLDIPYKEGKKDK